ncbi:hypothetical protein TNCT_563921 [Trichonephila clavata]|uniref:Uncharacterized protein n=1 Tax=Trichonephila clavata TaxID=2740835 RepID=A0A8X6H416_TRICU|nr:hypothetical protein TNCT_563921 [Trichonephila clavata]
MDRERPEMDTNESAPQEETQMSTLQKSTDLKSFKVSEKEMTSTEDTKACAKTNPLIFPERESNATSSESVKVELTHLQKRDHTLPKSNLKGRERDGSSESDNERSSEKKPKFCNLKRKIQDKEKNEGASKFAEKTINILKISRIERNATPQVVESSSQVISRSQPTINKISKIVPSDLWNERKKENRMVCSPKRSKVPMLNIDQCMDENSVPQLLKTIEKLKQHLKEIIESGISTRNTYRKKDYVHQSKEIQKRVEECYIKLEEIILFERTQKRFNELETRRNQQFQQQYKRPKEQQTTLMQQEYQQKLAQKGGYKQLMSLAQQGTSQQQPPLRHQGTYQHPVSLAKQVPSKQQTLTEQQVASYQMVPLEPQGASQRQVLMESHGTFQQQVVQETLRSKLKMQEILQKLIVIAKGPPQQLISLAQQVAKILFHGKELLNSKISLHCKELLNSKISCTARNSTARFPALQGTTQQQDFPALQGTSQQQDSLPWQGTSQQQDSLPCKELLNSKISSKNFSTARFSSMARNFSTARFSSMARNFSTARFSCTARNFSTTDIPITARNFSTTDFPITARSFSTTDFPITARSFSTTDFPITARSFSTTDFPITARSFSAARFSCAARNFSTARFSCAARNFSQQGTSQQQDSPTQQGVSQQQILPTQREYFRKLVRLAVKQYFKSLVRLAHLGAFQQQVPLEQQGTSEPLAPLEKHGASQQQEPLAQQGNTEQQASLAQQIYLQRLVQQVQQVYLEKLVRLAQHFRLTQQMTSLAQERASLQLLMEQQNVQDYQTPSKHRPPIPPHEKHQFQNQITPTMPQQHLVPHRVQVFQPQQTHSRSKPIPSREQLNQSQVAFIRQQLKHFLQKNQQTRPEQNVALRAPSFLGHLSVQQQLVSVADQKRLPIKQEIINIYTLFYYLTAASDISFTKDYLQDRLNFEYLKYIYIHRIRSLQKDSSELELLRNYLCYYMKAVPSYLVKSQRKINCGIIATGIDSINDMKQFNQLLKEKMYENKNVICNIIWDVKETNKLFKKFAALARGMRFKYVNFCSQKHEGLFK